MSDALTTEDLLLRAALACGMGAEDEAVHSAQLFYVVQGPFGARTKSSKNLQATLNHGCRKRIWERSKGAGLYWFGAAGRSLAEERCGRVVALLPRVEPDQCSVDIYGEEQGHEFLLELRDGRWKVFLNGDVVSGTEALAFFAEVVGTPEIVHESQSAPQRLRDEGVARGWQLRWAGPVLPAASTGLVDPHADFSSVDPTAPHANTSAGYVQDAVLRRVIEAHAMKLAAGWCASRYREVRDVSLEQLGYDIACSNPGGDQLHVEVKGTTTVGTDFEITRNEVDMLDRLYPRTALIVVRNISITRAPTGPVASGGQIEVVHPFAPREHDLEPTAYRCTLRPGHRA